MSLKWLVNEYERTKMDRASDFLLRYYTLEDLPPVLSPQQQRAAANVPWEPIWEVLGRIGREDLKAWDCLKEDG